MVDIREFKRLYISNPMDQVDQMQERSIAHVRITPQHRSEEVHSSTLEMCGILLFEQAVVQNAQVLRMLLCSASKLLQKVNEVLLSREGRRPDQVKNFLGEVIVDVKLPKNQLVAKS